MHADRAVILAYVKTEGRHRAPATGAREPSRRYETDRHETETPEECDAARDPSASRFLIQRQELAFPGRLAPRMPGVSPPTTQSHFIMALPVYEHLGARRRALAEPGHEAWIRLQRAAAVPVGDDEQGRHHAAIDTCTPEGAHVRLQCRRDVVDGNEKSSRRRESRRRAVRR